MARIYIKARVVCNFLGHRIDRKQKMSVVVSRKTFQFVPKQIETSVVVTRDIYCWVSPKKELSSLSKANSR